MNLDNNATTQIDPRVLEILIEELTGENGNPSSVHSLGKKAKKKLESCRSEIASYFSVKPHEIIFTSGGTEALNLIILGLLGEKKGHIITSSIEHSAVFHTVQRMEKVGFTATYLFPNQKGFIEPESVANAIQSQTRLIILSAANSETGVKNPLIEIGKIALGRKVSFAIDAIGIIGKEIFSIPHGAKAIACSGHKFHGPKGVGFAWIQSDTPVEVQISGGNQEFSKRGGTENLPAIVGLAKAVEILREELPEAATRIKILRDLLEHGIQENIQGIIIHGKDGERVCNTSNISFPNIDGELFTIYLDQAGIAISQGSACSSGSLEPSRVLLNMGIARDVVKRSLRFSLSRFTTLAEIEKAIEIICEIYNQINQKIHC
ncbi:MAG: cysteine desulfurase [Chlamydiae bacterium]|nr:cysteine desulfurase [Chlamydiota bacterium]